MGVDDTQEFVRQQTQPLPRTTAIKQTRRIAVAVSGGILVVAGIAMSVLPGPGILTLIVGLTVLSWEFPWAKKILHKLRTKLHEVRARRRSTPSS